MNTYIGIDLGTSGMKVLLVAANGKILKESSRTYPVSYPKSGWSEQDPARWLSAAEECLADVLDGQDKAAVRGISFGGQMHGLVALDKRGRVVRPCILWNDGRTEKETRYLNETVGKEKLSAYTGNIAFAGFTAPKLLWMREHERENFLKIDKIMLPKDYLAYELSGEHCTDCSDASGTLFFDVKNRAWSEEMTEILGIERRMLPSVYESYEVVGTLKKEYAEKFGLSADVRIAAGAGDNAAAAVGTGAVGAGECNLSLGTSGTLFVSSDTFAEDGRNALHSFCHADGKYHLLGCILSAASCNDWWMKSVLYSNDYAAEQAGAEALLGKNDVYFLPYLMGERSPHNDVNARGAFIGMRADTPRQAMTLAVMEGVVFALRDCAEAAKAGGTVLESCRLCGGGAKSPLWRRIVADIMQMPVKIPVTEQGPAYGAAILAMTGCGEYPSVKTAAEKLVKIAETVYPDESTAERYENKYRVFRTLYPALKDAFAAMGR